MIICMRQNSQNIKRKVAVPPVEWCDEAWVENKFGLPPNKIIDLLGLMGDSIDNIPGAPGIGEKGALKLILEFGSAEEAMKRADEVKHKTYRESLQNNQDMIRQSIELATVHLSVPVELDLNALTHDAPNRQLAYQLFRELEFSIFDARIFRFRAAVRFDRRTACRIAAPLSSDKNARRIGQIDSPSVGNRALEFYR